MARLQLKRGLKANLPTTGMLAGEPMVTTDRGTLHIATDAVSDPAAFAAANVLRSANDLKREW